MNNSLKNSNLLRTFVIKNYSQPINEIEKRLLIFSKKVLSYSQFYDQVQTHLSSLDNDFKEEYKKYNGKHHENRLYSYFLFDNFFSNMNNIPYKLEEEFNKIAADSKDTVKLESILMKLIIISSLKIIMWRSFKSIELV
jgi:hypothetical protein